jgi:hypothetical protein
VDRVALVALLRSARISAYQAAVAQCLHTCQQEQAGRQQERQPRRCLAQRRLYQLLEQGRAQTEITQLRPRIPTCRSGRRHTLLDRLELREQDLVDQADQTALVVLVGLLGLLDQVAAAPEPYSME